ncbi:6-phospho-3-hexuloisomerase [Paenibacillus sp. MER TA 81-3]|uniref:6-phospho-3-hexuloisomerase n=1 Tax=Paenibacillus sp. MER TA 81-3 TaxID=2939573 RepID=UPI00203C018B|nr:6-phospho-3-hexuloisomerase [Paenibacillus sp. MER TA 81-3]MCM3340357.1 6-phospho-3-hexuloisomerase [Paenibacillus sp. MER TA 81-3]
METVKYAAEIVQELHHAVERIAEEEAEQLADIILQSKQVFLAGAGRSGLMGRAFAMRLMHSGMNAYVVGETVTPGISKDDVLIISSGSGETKSLIPMAQKAKSLGASVVTVTINPESTIGRLSDVAVMLPGAPKDKANGSYATIQPMASLFEQTLLVFYDAVILRMMDKRELDSDRMYGRHANLE